jgi:hypothetical protein
MLHGASRHGILVTAVCCQPPVCCPQLHADVIVIEEISMLPSDVYNMLMLKIEGVLRNERYADTCPLRNKLIILVGDLQQLPPVCRQHKIDRASYCRTCHISSTAWWQQRVQHELSSNVRHAHDSLVRWGLQWRNWHSAGHPPQRQRPHVPHHCLNSCSS